MIGHDTLFLAELVGNAGHVYGFDIQPAAVESTRSRLRDAGLEHRVTLRLQGHETIESVVQKTVSAATFNLGYLPGHDDKSVITLPDTTVSALEQCAELLTPGGIISVVLYVGHSGGKDEAEAVLAWAEQIDIAAFQVEHFTSPARNDPPELLIVNRAIN